MRNNAVPINGHDALYRVGTTGWQLAPECAAVHAAERIAVIADVHLGYEWARGASGDCVPAHSLAETLHRLSTLVERCAIDRLVVAGDLVESPAPCARTDADVARLRGWLSARGIALVPLAGNHDRAAAEVRTTLEVAGWTIGHGHRKIAAARTISGHHHPILRAGCHASPAFLVGPKRIVLPAFSRNAAGGNVASPSVAAHWRHEPLHCLACPAGEWLDFGPLSRLPARLRAL
jgi:putative SbcD/Mre11-related phosphoesterase